MKLSGINRLASIAAVGLCSVGFLGNLFAAQLPKREAPFLSAIRTTPLAIAHLAPPALQPPMMSTRLDLRVPHDPFAQEIRAGGAAPAFRDYPTGALHQVRGLEGSGTNDHGTRSGFGISGTDFRMASPTERFVDRVHREGLPVARLWQSESALLSIGLNQRGKPGVWFTKTVR
jgi:hypothetical protein